MSVFKIEKNKNYTIMGNFHLRDKNLSYKAKGLLSFMLSLPDDWDYSMRGLESSEKIDVWSLNVYNVILMTAPDSEFNNWQSILDNCLSSLEFSDTFVNEFNKEESNILSTIQANQKVYDEMSDMIMDSWENRNNSYDIISQKQSDATLGYERVYDTETGEIYKAYNGLTDDYTGERYKTITDDMYTESISGTIEK